MVNYGQQFTDAYIKKDLIRKIIYHNANLLSVGVKVAPQMSLNALDVKFDYPGSMTGQYPVADEAVAPREKITWSEFKLNLQKAQLHYFITDVAKLRGIAGTQNEINARRAAEALAKLKDDEILDVLHAGIGGTVAAGAVWTNVSSDPEQDIVSAWNNILTNSNVTTSELSNMSLIVPAKTYGSLQKLQLIGNIQQSLNKYLKQTFSISIIPTRSTELGTSSSTDALLMVNGNMTARHGVLSDGAARAAGVPLVEKDRVVGSGDDYLVSQFYRTTVIEDGSAGTGLTYRIYKISGVCT